VSKQEFLTRFAELLELENASLAGNEKITDLGTWDSMKILEFMAMADEQFSVIVSPSALAKCQTVDDLIGLLEGKVA
jgi:acyl carrier protein